MILSCQFVVKADGDYSVYLADPDLLVPWESIEQIVSFFRYVGFFLGNQAVEFARGFLMSRR